MRTKQVAPKKGNDHKKTKVIATKEKAALVSKKIKAQKEIDGVKVRKAHRFRPGTVALREIRKYQRSTDMLIKRAPFRRLIREIAQDYKDDVRFQKSAIDAIQEATESYITSLFTDSNLAALHTGRTTVMANDLHLTLRMRGERS